MTDNFRLIKDFIQSQWGGQFDSFTNVFYVIEIIGRAKDNANIKSLFHLFIVFGGLYVLLNDISNFSINNGTIFLS